MRVLVTGANGFLGRYLLQELQSQGHQTLAFVRSQQSAKTINDVQCDVQCDFTSVDAPSSHVFHFLSTADEDAQQQVFGGLSNSDRDLRVPPAPPNTDTGGIDIYTGEAQNFLKDTVQPLDNGEQNILIVNIYMDMHLNLK